jgi:uncharacterized protein (DUF58 family)
MHRLTPSTQRPAAGFYFPAGNGRFSLPRAGFAWMLILVFLLAVGLFRNINLLLLLGDLMLAVFLLNAVAAGGPLRRLKARRCVIGPIVAGKPCIVELKLTGGRRGAVGLCVEDLGPAHRLTGFVLRLTGGEEAFRGRVVLPRRGRYPWGPVIGYSRYPFGLVQRHRVLGPGEETIVLPRAGRLHRGRFRQLLLGGAFAQDRVRRLPRRHPAAQDQFHGLRAFRPGDSPRAIHWRTTARRGEYMVREFEDLPGDVLQLVFDPTAPPASNEANDRFEAAVSLAAAVAVDWRRETGDRLIAVVAGSEPVVLDGATGPGQTRRVLEALALVEPQAAARVDAAALLGRLADLPPAAIVVIGAGGGSMADRLRRALDRPVLALDGASVDGYDFYEPPPALDPTAWKQQLC